MNFHITAYEARYVRFEDIKTRDDLNLISIYKIRQQAYVTYIMDETTFKIQAILNAHLLHIKGTKNRKEKRELPNEEIIEGTFMFGGSKNWVNKLFESGFNGVLPKGIYKAKDLIQISNISPVIFYDKEDKDKHSTDKIHKRPSDL